MKYNLINKKFRCLGHTIVASFRLLRSVSALEDYAQPLKADLFDVFGAANSKV